MEEHVQAMEKHLAGGIQVYHSTLRELLAIIEKWEKEPGGGYSFPSELVERYFTMCSGVQDPVLLAFIMDVKGRFAACSGEMVLSLIKTKE